MPSTLRMRVTTVSLEPGVTSVTSPTKVLYHPSRQPRAGCSCQSLRLGVLVPPVRSESCLRDSPSSFSTRNRSCPPQVDLGQLKPWYAHPSPPMRRRKRL